MAPPGVAVSDFFDDDDFAAGVALDPNGKAYAHQAVAGEHTVILGALRDFLIVARLMAFPVIQTRRGYQVLYSVC